MVDQPSQDDIKRKFREALDHKQSHEHVEDGEHGRGGKVGGPHAAETSAVQQQFHRKSGA